MTKQIVQCIQKWMNEFTQNSNGSAFSQFGRKLPINEMHVCSIVDSVDSDIIAFSMLVLVLLIDSIILA